MRTVTKTALKRKTKARQLTCLLTVSHILPTPEFTPSKLADRPRTLFAYDTPQSARETLPPDTVLSKEQVDQDDVTCLNACGGLNTDTVGITECAEDDSEHGLADIECVAEKKRV